MISATASEDNEIHQENNVTPETVLKLNKITESEPKMNIFPEKYI